MLKKNYKIIFGTIVAIGIFGCAQHSVIQTESQLEKNWGRSFENAKYSQMLNPEAGKVPDPVEGLEGPAADNIIKSYMSGGRVKQKTSPEFGVVTIKQ